MPDDNMSDAALVVAEGNPAPGAPPVDAPAASEDSDIRKARRENQNLRTRLKDLETAQAQRDEQERIAAGEFKTLAEARAARIAELEAAIADRDRAALLAAVASKYHLPAELAERLRGEDEDSLEADAKALAKLIPAPAPPPPGLPTNPARAARVTDLDSLDAYWQSRDKGRSKSGFKL
jgi:hypothetical protein